MLTEEEKELLKQLQEKDSKTNVIRLIPGGKEDNNILVEKLRFLLQAAEQGEFQEFVFIGLHNSDKANIQWSGPVTFAMLGAINRAVHILNNRGHTQ